MDVSHQPGGSQKSDVQEGILAQLDHPLERSIQEVAYDNFRADRKENEGEKEPRREGKSIDDSVKNTNDLRKRL